jgi:hypothetical protein
MKRKVNRGSSEADASTRGRTNRLDEHELAALVEELLDAHLDTIEIMLQPDAATECALSHVGYLRALYRQGQAMTAALPDGLGATNGLRS